MLTCSASRVRGSGVQEHRLSSDLDRVVLRDRAAHVAIDQGSRGQQAACAAAEGSAAWMHDTGGRGEGGWLRGR